MPKPAPHLPETVATHLQGLGAQIRERRKALGVSATVVAESAGVSRVTLHRIEKGASSVTVGAWASVAQTLGIGLQVQQFAALEPATDDHAGWIPAQIDLTKYPQLKSLAWQVHGTDTLTPGEAFDIYERNARHLDMAAMSVSERDLWQALRSAFATGGRGV
jgi:transcriptional regulator with XRE-family HTH domain